ncbi:hypothetical protein, partial [Klebsiella pneumoniae]|uniref:hypothetical protein n=2 Tax=Klebsiella pneumoniae TaxID=573 RepID=UPI0026EE7123
HNPLRGRLTRNLIYSTKPPLYIIVDFTLAGCVDHLIYHHCLLESSNETKARIQSLSGLPQSGVSEKIYITGGKNTKFNKIIKEGDKES